MHAPAPTNRSWASNLPGWDFRVQARELDVPGVEIIDVHTHIHGRDAAALYDTARRLFGVTRTYTMTQLPRAQEVREVLGDSVRFIAMPEFWHPERAYSMRAGYLRTIEAFAERFGSRMMKIWGSPRLRDMIPDGGGDACDIDAPWRREHARLAAQLGMMIMVHVADPDSYFRAGAYRDRGRYGTKDHHYLGLRRMLDDFPVPWIAAHMGGSPEDLDRLDTLLTAHPNLHLDTSATKWQVRALSRHEPRVLAGFFTKWRTRIMFGTDLVTLDEQLSTTKTGMSVMGDLASSPEEAFELYCSRHWAQRALFETGYDGPSPIADPDVRLDDPSLPALTGPRLRGMSLPADVLADLYHHTARRVVDAWWERKD